MKVFVSVIDEEAGLASVLKDWIGTAFLGQVEVFVSTVDISSGEQWFRRLEEELTDARVLLVICSPGSVKMPWINFETGACHINGIPVIPICHSGITPDTLPIPLVFFQGLDAKAEDFCIRVMTDLAGHLGYPQSPQIRYEEMVVAVSDALSHTGQPSEQAGQGEMGSLDHLVSMMENMETLTGLVQDFGNSTEEITLHTQTYGDQASTVRPITNSGGPQHLQRLSRDFGRHLDTYAGRLEVLNRKYGSVLPEVESSMQHVVTSQAPQTEEDWEDIDGFLTTLDTVEQNLSEWKQATFQSRGVIDGLPNVQREMRQAARKIVSQFDVLTANLDSTLAMIQRVKITIQRLMQGRDAGQDAQ